MSFPSSPTNGQQATVNGTNYSYNSAQNTWSVVASTPYFNNITVSGNTTTGNLTATTANISGNLYVGNVITTSGIFYPNGATAGGGGGGTPGGANTMVQFNNSGSFNGATYLQYNITSGNLVSNSTTTATSTTTGALVLAGGLGVNGNIYASNLNLTSTTASAITTVLTRGSDINFQLSAQNGSSSNATGAETARFGINYSGIGWDSFIQFIRGSSSQNGSLALWAANTAVANVASTSIYPVSNNAITLGTASGQYFSAIYANNHYGSNFNGINVVTTGNIYSGGNIVAASSTNSTSSTTGALVVSGGAGISGNVYVGGNIYTQQRTGYTYSGNNTSVAYTFYNATTNSIDTVFG